MEYQQWIYHPELQADKIEKIAVSMDELQSIRTKTFEAALDYMWYSGKDLTDDELNDYLLICDGVVLYRGDLETARRVLAEKKDYKIALLNTMDQLGQEASDKYFNISRI